VEGRVHTAHRAIARVTDDIGIAEELAQDALTRSRWKHIPKLSAREFLSRRRRHYDGRETGWQARIEFA
jgi:hypothetical protein